MDLVKYLGTHSSWSPPRSNGELVFNEPWESRAFGMAATLADGGVFSWSEFQASLIKAIADRDQFEPYHYYECWSAALEALVIERGLLSVGDINGLVEDFCKRPQGHDHHHHHDHDHDDDHTHHHHGHEH